MFPENNYKNCIGVFTFTPAVCLDPCQVLVDMVFTQGQQILSTTALLLGWPWLFATVCITVNTVAGQMEAHHNLHIQLFLFRIPYYNYILITGWLVQESRQKGGLCRHKKVHCGPVSEQVPFSSSRMRAWKRGLSKCWLCVRIQVAINVIVMAYHNLICYSNRQLHITSVPVW